MLIHPWDAPGSDAEWQQWLAVHDFGLENGWQAKAIQPYGRNENSGTRAFFQEHVLLKGAYRPEVKALDDQFATVEAVAADPAGIAYGPIQHKVQGVRAVPLACRQQFLPPAGEGLVQVVDEGDRLRSQDVVGAVDARPGDLDHVRVSFRNSWGWGQNWCASVEPTRARVALSGLSAVAMRSK